MDSEYKNLRQWACSFPIHDAIIGLIVLMILNSSGTMTDPVSELYRFQWMASPLGNASAVRKGLPLQTKFTQYALYGVIDGKLQLLSSLHNCCMKYCRLLFPSVSAPSMNFIQKNELMQVKIPIMIEQRYLIIKA